jgi:ppGpp synthetase/RelA/SpoT-type nucleotidyltranferase
MGADDMMDWVKRENSKGAIDRAGQRLMQWWTTPNEDMPTEEWSPIYHVVDNWRACHGLPLNVIQAGLRARIRRLKQNALVAQRLKRFSSIMNKLARESDMKLSQMQDLGGCRAILSSISTVNALYRMYQEPQPSVFAEEEGSLKCYNYISKPKEDGYRGIHVVARYHPRLIVRTPWNGQRIEIQLRTKLQHAFATTVETVTTFTREPLKFGAGPSEWRRFFSLMGSALAIRERTPLVENTPSDETELIAELREAAKALKVTPKLRGWARALRTLRRKHIKNYKWLLLTLDTTMNTIGVRGFQNREEASQTVAELEKSKRSDLDAVLVWVDSIQKLRAAYPNYYADANEFLTALDTAIAKKQ